MRDTSKTCQGCLRKNQRGRGVLSGEEVSSAMSGKGPSPAPVVEQNDDTDSDETESETETETETETASEMTDSAASVP